MWSNHLGRLSGSEVPAFRGSGVLDARCLRREFCVTAGLAAGGLVVGRGLLRAALLEQSTGWATVPGILARIVPPTFPSRDFDITRFGAKGDGVTDCTAALRDAIAACANAGGGRVVVPGGQFVTGAIRLQSRVNLHLADDAALRFSQAPRDFLPMVLTRFEGVELFNYSPFIYAFDARDIAITGRGTLDGQADADHWWPWKAQTADRTRLLAARRSRACRWPSASSATVTFSGRTSFSRIAVTNVLIEGVTIVNSPMWEIHPVLCTNVTIRGVTIVEPRAEQRRLQSRVVP